MGDYTFGKEHLEDLLPEYLFHVVQKGENLFRISVKYNVPLDRLAQINNLKVNNPIYPGQKIKLP